MKGHWWTTALVVGSLALLIVSCDDPYTTGAGMMQSIQDEVTAATAPTVAVLVSSDTGSATVSPTGNVTQKEGVAFEISTTLPDDYAFVDWEVGQTSATVTFADAKNPVTKATITKKPTDASELVNIKAVFVPRPVIRISTPNGEGVLFTKNISVTFSKMMDHSKFTADNVKILNVDTGVDQWSQLAAPSFVDVQPTTGNPYGTTTATFRLKDTVNGWGKLAYITVSYKKTLTDVAGNQMREDNDTQWFKTGVVGDSSAPFIMSPPGVSVKRKSSGTAYDTVVANNSYLNTLDFEVTVKSRDDIEVSYLKSVDSLAPSSPQLVPVTPESTNYTSTFRPDLTIPTTRAPGTYTLSFIAVDSSNKESTPEVFTYNYDAIAPTIQPVSLSGWKKGTVGISGTSADTGGSSLVSMEYKIDSGSWTTATGTANWSANIDTTVLSFGSHTISLRATDGAGNIGTDSLGLDVDNAGPIITPVALTGYKKGTISISGTTSDGSGAGVASMEYRIDAGSWANTIGTTNWSASIDTTGLSNGNHTISLRSNDNISNLGTNSLSLDVDNAIPIVTPAAFSGWKKGTVSISGTSSDSGGSTLVSMEYQIDSGSWTATTGTASWSASIDTTTLTNDNHTINLRATDGAGNIGTNVLNLNVDNIPPSLSIADLGTGYYGASITVGGTASDGSGNVSGLNKVQYSLTNDGTDWADATGTNNWSKTIDLTGLATEGSKTLFIRVLDNAGNVGTGSDTFILDRNDPSLDETAINTVSQVYKKASFTLSGSATDGNALANIVITATQNAVAKGTVFSSATAGTYTYTKTVDTTPTHADDGLWVYTITATDVVGRTTSLNRTVLVDTTAPTVSITDLGTGYYGASITVGGTAGDGSGNVSGLNKVQYSLTNNGTDWADATGTDNWSKTINLTGLATEGNKTLYIQVLDNAGNVGTGSDTFILDRNDPSLDETAINTVSQVYKKATFTLSGSATDGNALANIVITATQNAAAKGTVFSSATAGTYTYTKTVDTTPTHADDGLWVYTITATDVVGRTTSLNRTVLVDTTAPTVSITDLGTGYYGASITIGGTAGDGSGNVSGLNKVQYSLTNNGTDWADATGTDSWSKTIDLTGLTTEGNKIMYIRVLDNAGNVGTGSDTFILDRNDPSLDETAINTASQVYKKASFTLSGSATDGNALASIVITATQNAAAKGTVFSSATAGTYTYTKTVDTTVTHVDDGLWVYTITATDVVGRTTSLNRTVLVDTTAPTVSITDLGTGYYGASIAVGGTAGDGSGNVSGLNKVQYSLTNDGTDWVDATGTNNWSKTIDLTGLTTEGNKTLYIQVLDNAGNVGTGSDTFILDRSDPSLDETAINTASQVYKKVSFTLSGSASDTNAYSSVVITATKNSVSQGTVLTDSTTGGYTYTKTVDTTPAHADDGLWVYTITATDVVGRTTSLNRTVLVDTTVPTVIITDLGTGYYDASIAVGGTAGDGSGNVSGLNKVQYSLTNDGTDWADATGTNNWSKTIDLTGLASEGNKTLYIRVLDNAGNVGTGSDTFILDRSDPSLDETAINTASQVYKKVSFTLSGSASDTNEYGSVVITATKNSVSQGTVLTDSTTGGYTYTKTVDTTSTHADDGLWVYTITATDVVGRTKVLTRTVRVDTIAPSLTGLNISDTSGNETVTTGSLTVVVVGDADTGGSGIKEYRILDNGTGGSTQTTTSSPSTYAMTGTAGSHGLTMEIEDQAGNIYTSSSFAFTLDKTHAVLGPVDTSDNGTIFTVVIPYSLPSGYSGQSVKWSTDGSNWNNPTSSTPATGQYTITFAYSSTTDLYFKIVTTTPGSTSAIKHIVYTTSWSRSIMAGAARHLPNGSQYVIRTNTYADGNPWITIPAQPAKIAQTVAKAFASAAKENEKVAISAVTSLKPTLRTETGEPPTARTIQSLSLVRSSQERVSPNMVAMAEKRPTNTSEASIVSAEAMEKPARMVQPILSGRYFGGWLVVDVAALARSCIGE